MHASVRRVALAVTEGLDMVTILVGGAIGAWAGYTYSPDTWMGDCRLAVTGAVAVVMAVVFNGMAGLFLAPLRRLVNKSRHPRPRTGIHTAAAAPSSLDEGLAQVVAATEDDAASRAATRLADRSGRPFPAGREAVARLRGRRSVFLPRPRRLAPPPRREGPVRRQ
ncbi:hypothetical protein [Streptomyces sp. NPDC004533]|uniref:hypothetical protein n=1 Tax=Streptomyces sp. NPDC004533 TaxID=3154278 RepID=UPI0033B57EBF